ncbi:hypothetical protein ES708_14491 [subsurface metagenome]
MTDNLKIGENRIKDLRNKDGTFKEGTQIGRMPKKGFTLADLTKLVRKYDKTQDVSLLEHYVEQLRKDNRLLDKYMDRYVPVKTINELTGPGGEPIKNIILHKIIYGKGKKGEKNNTGEAESG